jgi:hypothetical protein
MVELFSNISNTFVGSLSAGRIGVLGFVRLSQTPKHPRKHSVHNNSTFDQFRRFSPSSPPPTRSVGVFACSFFITTHWTAHQCCWKVCNCKMQSALGSRASVATSAAAAALRPRTPRLGPCMQHTQPLRPALIKRPSERQLQHVQQLVSPVRAAGDSSSSSNSGSNSGGSSSSSSDKKPGLGTWFDRLPPRTQLIIMGALLFIGTVSLPRVCSARHEAAARMLQTTALAGSRCCLPHVGAVTPPSMHTRQQP